MKYHYFATVSSALIVLGCTSGEAPQGSGKPAVEFRTLPPFEEVVVHGAAPVAWMYCRETFEVALHVPGLPSATPRPPMVVVAGDDRLLSEVKTDVRDGVLTITAGGRTSGVHRPKVAVSWPDGVPVAQSVTGCVKTYMTFAELRTE